MSAHKVQIGLSSGQFRVALQVPSVRLKGLGSFHTGSIVLPSQGSLREDQISLHNQDGLHKVMREVLGYERNSYKKFFLR
uniref:Ixosin n=1 Tax=Ixodes sinensis TaxID=339422 RepID=IXOSN_IXOSI|nr:RecName: Full=Ixosin; Flags: Precursor [Ixodes sinensis]AAZ57202.1 ixosin [Ixodes sinensis]